MFKRRVSKTIMAKAVDFCWPSIGWRRSLRYIRLRIIRLSDSTHKVAAGLATGAAISFTPLVGSHFIQAMGVAYVFRFNMLSSVIGTFVGNPWTFPFMWWTAISFGAFLFDLFGLPASTSLPDELSFSILLDLILHEPLRIFLPWLVGGYLLALISWPVSYYMFFFLVKGAKAARRKARILKMHKAAKDITGQKV